MDMTAQEIRNAYLEFAKQNGHTVIPRANLVPQNDPTTLFTGSGMQPLITYLLGEPHPNGSRIADSQTCLRAEDIEEVGDNRHTTFFEMLGNWSFGDYFKQEQLPWFFTFLTEIVGLDANKLYVTTFIGDKQAGVPKDTESAQIWQKLFADTEIDAKVVEIGSEQDGYNKGMQDGRIFYYDAKKNWWSRAGVPSNMPAGEPGGPDSEVFYEFTQIEHDPKWGKHCHPNCDCGRFMEIGNSVFMQYVKNDDGTFSELPKANVDFGGGLERIAAAKIDSPDMFKISVLWPIIERLQSLSGKNYEQHTSAMRVIADHLRTATFLAVDGVVPSNKTQGYVMRRFMRRAIRYAFELGIEQNFIEQVVPTIADLYHNDYPEVANNRNQIIAVLAREEKVFRQTLRNGIKEFSKLTKQGQLTGEIIFKLYDTYGFPVELTKEEAFKQDITISDDATQEFDKLMAEQKARSQTAAKGVFKGGLADHSEITTKYHTATHLMYKALRIVLGDHVIQRGSNITSERLRFDFSHSEKVNPEQIKQVEDIVNEQINKDWPMSYREENTKEALDSGVMGAFGDKYGDTVKVYTVGDPDGENYSREICGGPHVEHTGKLAEGGKVFKIKKEEASSAGVRRIKAVLV
jgi:alanyl-tRNA synthetase